LRKTLTRERSVRESSGKPDAGNLHIRFDEGKGFIRKDAPPYLPKSSEASERKNKKYIEK